MSGSNGADGTAVRKPIRLPRQAADIEQSPRTGRQQGTWGWLIVIAGSVCLGPAWQGPLWLRWVLVATGVLLLLTGAWMVLRGQRHVTRVLTGFQHLPADERVVLFLRAFSDDSGFSRVSGIRLRRLGAWTLSPAHLRTEEEQVARAVMPFGRMVALGRPSDKLPRPGAERHYASDEEWRTQVLAALDRADLLLLAAGAGRNLRWEVEQVVSRNDPTRLVLVVTRGREQYAQFRAALGELLPKGLPDYPAKKLRQLLLRGRYVRAAIWFDEDWTPHFELLDGRFPLSGLARRTQLALPRALRKVYQRADVPERVEPTTTRPWAVKLGVALIALFWLVPFAWALSLVFIPSKAFEELSEMSDGASSSREFGEGGPNSTSVIDFLATFIQAMVAAWPFWLLVTVVAVWISRVWRGGHYAIMLARLHGIMVPVLFLSFAVSVFFAPQLQMVLMSFALLAFLPDGMDIVRLVLLDLVVLLLGVSGLFSAAILFIRHDAREWIDSRM